MVDLIENLLEDVREHHGELAWKAHPGSRQRNNDEYRDRQRLIERAESFLRDYKARHENMIQGISQ